MSIAIENSWFQNLFNSFRSFFASEWMSVFISFFVFALVRKEKPEEMNELIFFLFSFQKTNFKLSPDLFPLAKNCNSVTKNHFPKTDYEKVFFVYFVFVCVPSSNWRNQSGENCEIQSRAMSVLTWKKIMINYFLRNFWNFCLTHNIW